MEAVMYIRLYVAVILIGALIQISVAISFGENFRCPNGNIISDGTELAVVRSKCDPPTYIDKRYEPAGKYGSGAVEVQVWTYDGGPYTFVYYLTFTNGVLTKIVSGDYGTDKK
jgi:hypothetical protein